MANSLPVEVARLRRELAQVKKGQRVAHGASLENAALTVNDGGGSLRTVLGPLGDGTVGVMAVNGPPPPQPTPPIVASVLGGVIASWDGQFAGGAVIPLDWSRIEVHAAITPVYDPLPATLVTTIETAQGATVVIPCDTPVYVRLLARTASGTASAASDTVGPYGPMPVVADDILDGIVTEVKLANAAVTAAKIATAAVGSTALQDGAVLGAKLADLAVTTGKLADLVITDTKLAAAAVTSAKVAAGAINSAAIADAAVNAQKIADAAVIAGKLAASAVTSTTIANDAVTAGKVAADAITAREVAAGSINTVELAAGAVTTNELAASAVTAGKIAASQIQATHITAGAVQTAALAADAVAAGKVAADAITARELAAASVTASEIAANAVTANAVAAGAITTDKLTVTGGANILTDPSFEGAYTAACIAGLSYATQDTTSGNGSPTSLKIDATAATGTYRSVQLTALPVLPGDQLNLGIDYWVSADWAGTDISFQIRWETSAGAILSYGKAAVTSPVRSTWTRVTGTFTAPAAATVARIRVESGNGTAGFVRFDNGAVRPVLPGTQIQDGAITTVKIVADAILATQIAAGAVLTDKLAANAVTAAKIAALTITANEIAANAITVGKLAAGSVDATALSATAITGKTITGGTITGSLIQTAASGERITLNEAAANKIIVYNSSGVAINELSALGLLVKGSTGAVLWLNPNATYPQLQLYNAANTNKATVQVVENVTGDANLENISGTFTGSTYPDMVWRSYLARDNAVIERRRASVAKVIGSRLYMETGFATLGIHNDDDPTQECSVYIEPNYIHVDAARFQVNPPASANTVITASAATGHTGKLLNLQVNSVDKLTVDKDGNLSAANFPDGAWQDWTPAWTTSSGSATPSFGNATILAKYTKIGRTVLWRLEITFGSTTNFGSSPASTDNWRFSAPVTAAGTSLDCGFGEVQDASAAGGGIASRLGARVRLTTTTTFELETATGRVDGAALTTPNWGVMDALTPWTWANGDGIRVSGFYESAS